LVADTRNRKVEEISQLEHELSEATTSMKSSLEVALAYKLRVAQAKVELKLSNIRCRVVVWEEKEKKRVAELEKAKKGLKWENSAFEAKKMSVETSSRLNKGMSY